MTPSTRRTHRLSYPASTEKRRRSGRLTQHYWRNCQPIVTSNYPRAKLHHPTVQCQVMTSPLARSSGATTTKAIRRTMAEVRRRNITHAIKTTCKTDNLIIQEQEIISGTKASKTRQVDIGQHHLLTSQETTSMEQSEPTSTAPTDHPDNDSHALELSTLPRKTPIRRGLT